MAGIELGGVDIDIGPGGAGGAVGMSGATPEGPANFPTIPKRGTGNVHLKRKRRKKGEEGEGPAQELNLTAMMDMMTIILVFLLKSYSTSSIDVKAGVDLQLPASSTKLPPIDAISITITGIL